MGPSRMTEAVSTPWHLTGSSDGRLLQTGGGTGELTLSPAGCDHSASSQPVPKSQSLVLLPKPRASAQGPQAQPKSSQGQDFYLENHSHCKPLKAGTTQDLSSSRKSLPPAPCYSLPYIIFHVRAHKCCCGSPA